MYYLGVPLSLYLSLYTYIYIYIFTHTYIHYPLQNTWFLRWSYFWSTQAMSSSGIHRPNVCMYTYIYIYIYIYTCNTECLSRRWGVCGGGRLYSWRGCSCNNDRTCPMGFRLQHKVRSGPSVITVIILNNIVIITMHTYIYICTYTYIYIYVYTYKNHVAASSPAA